MKLISYLRVLGPIVLVTVIVRGAHAAPVEIPHGQLELVARATAITEKRFEVGLHFQLEPGWHIYWVNPGDSGEPPRVEWHLPPGTSAGAIQWPVPKKLASGSVADYGYEGDVLLPVTIHVGSSLSANQLQIGADVKLLVCSHQMCIPGKANLALTLLAEVGEHAAPADGRSSNWFENAEKSMPLPVPKEWKFSAKDEKDSFVIDVDLGRRTTDHPVSQVTFFPLEVSQIDNAAPQKVVGSRQGIEMTLRKSDQLTGAVTHLNGLLVFQSGKAYSVDIPVSTAGSVAR